MQDATFIASLASRDLLPGDTSSKIEGLSTTPDKALYLLNHIIKPSIHTGDTDCFNALLSIMEECEYKHIKKLAAEIKSKIDGNPHYVANK